MPGRRIERAAGSPWRLETMLVPTTPPVRAHHFRHAPTLSTPLKASASAEPAPRLCITPIAASSLASHVVFEN